MSDYKYWTIEGPFLDWVDEVDAREYFVEISEVIGCHTTDGCGSMYFLHVIIRSYPRPTSRCFKKEEDRDLAYGELANILLRDRALCVSSTIASPFQRPGYRGDDPDQR